MNWKLKDFHKYKKIFEYFVLNFKTLKTFPKT